jgi:HEAT repeat protein
VCTAHRSDGTPCRKAPILGGTVCDVHGGRAPQVKRSAQERLAMMVDPAIVELRRIMLESEIDSVRLIAIRDVLDRALGKPQQHVDVTSQGEQIKAYVGVDLDKV